MKTLLVVTILLSQFSAYAGCRSDVIQFGKDKGMLNRLITEAAETACLGHRDSNIYECMNIAWRAYAPAQVRIRLKGAAIACSYNRNPQTVQECLEDGGLGMGSYWDFSPARFCQKQQRAIGN